MWKTKTEAFETRGNVILITWTCANDSYGAFPKRQRLECFTVDGRKKYALQWAVDEKEDSVMINSPVGKQNQTNIIINTAAYM